MSEEPTKDMPQKYDTKPTIETVLERMEAIRSDMQAMRSDMQAMRSDIMEALHSEIRAVRVEMQVGFDRVESVAVGTRAEFLTLRGDFRELKHALGEHIPALKP